MKILPFILILLTPSICNAGMDFTHWDMAMTVSSDDYYSGYDLPDFVSLEEATEWGNKTKYAEQWRRLLNKKMLKLKVDAANLYSEKGHNIIVAEEVKVIMSKWYFNKVAYVLIDNKRDRAMIMPPDFIGTNDALEYGRRYKDNPEAIEGLRYMHDKYLADFKRLLPIAIQTKKFDESARAAFKKQFCREALEAAGFNPNGDRAQVGAEFIASSIPCKNIKCE